MSSDEEGGGEGEEADEKEAARVRQQLAVASSPVQNRVTCAGVW